MNKEILQKIRDDKEVYMFLKYNSYYYKYIYRNDVSWKEIETLKNEFFQKTPVHKIKKISERIRTINDVLEIFK